MNPTTDEKDGPLCIQQTRSRNKMKTVAELKSQIPAPKAVQELIALAATLESQLAAALANVERYGQHERHCGHIDDSGEIVMECTCGFDAAKKGTQL